jgi:Ca2+-binding EF-hand superfamily protein
MEPYIYETLEGKVDLDKVREIRRLIRRRYGNRKRVQKIFQQWDKEKKGNISV